MRISDWSSDVCSSDLQRIVIERLRLDDDSTGAADQRPDRDRLGGPVEAAHFAGPVSEMVAPAMGKISNLFVVGVEGAGCNLMQQRFPDVAGVTVHERYRRALPCSHSVPETVLALEATGSAADTDNPFGSASPPALPH